MENIHYAGLDVHKKTIAYCIKTATCCGGLSTRKR